jgi:hypothetical protein
MTPLELMKDLIEMQERFPDREISFEVGGSCSDCEKNFEFETTNVEVKNSRFGMTIVVKG